MKGAKVTVDGLEYGITKDDGKVTNDKTYPYDTEVTILIVSTDTKSTPCFAKQEKFKFKHSDKEVQQHTIQLTKEGIRVAFFFKKMTNRDPTEVSRFVSTR